MSIDFRSSFLYLISASCLLLGSSVLAQDNSCTTTNDIGMCGLNGICLVSADNSFNCSCPPGFDVVDNSNHSKGCLQNPSQQLGCNASSAEMQELDKKDWPFNDYAHFTGMNQTACKQACIEDCFCTVVIYADLNGTENCWKKAMPLRKGLESESRTAFVKVYKALPPTPPADIPPTPSKHRKEKGKMLVIIGISLVSCSTLFAAILLIIWLYSCRPKLKASQENHKFNSEGLKVFSYRELDAATGGFKQQIGRGAFGKVYKGELSDKREIAVKELDKLVKKSEQDGEKEFRTEMSIIGASHHKNLVQLYGFCDERSHKLLVYEFMPNGSLDSFLFERKIYLDWDVRVRIALGIAKGILYLHEECRKRILHCDIKPQNILLDGNYNAKLSDFGIAKLIGAEQTRTFTVARGTLGYMAPEWQRNMAITVKVDVYSFGVVLSEIICCRKMLELDVPENEMILSDWVYNCFKDGRLVNLVEQQECRDMELRQLERMVLVGQNSGHKLASGGQEQKLRTKKKAYTFSFVKVKMTTAFSCAKTCSMIDLTTRGPEASFKRRGIRVDAGYGTKLYVGSNCMHAKISAGRNATHFIRALVSRDEFFGKSLILRYFHQKMNVRTGSCRCATSEETYAEKQLTEEDAIERMKKTLEAMKSNFNSIRTGRSSPALLDRVEVEYYGSPVNLKSLAQVSVADGNSLLVQPFDKSSLKPIEKAISKSNLGLTPSSDGNFIRLSIPQLTSERRKELLKVVGKMAEEGKVAIRNIRRDAIKTYGKLEKEKKLSKDNVKDFSDDMQKITDEYIKKADSLYKEKEKELMTI